MQHEPWIERDKVMIDMLKSIGIQKGKPFAPDEKTTGILNEGIAEARAWLDHRYKVFHDLLQRRHAMGASALPGVWKA